MPSIDVGSAATNRDLSAALGTTYIDMANAANLDGIIETLELWANTTMSGCKVGIFERTTGDKFKCRAVADIGAVTAGSKQTFSGLSLAIKTGDFIGLYNTGGKLEYGTGGVGRSILAGNHVIVNDESTYGVYMGSGSFSLYGIGATVVAKGNQGIIIQ